MNMAVTFFSRTRFVLLSWLLVATVLNSVASFPVHNRFQTRYRRVISLRKLQMSTLMEVNVDVTVTTLPQTIAIAQTSQTSITKRPLKDILRSNKTSPTSFTRTNRVEGLFTWLEHYDAWMTAPNTNNTTSSDMLDIMKQLLYSNIPEQVLQLYPAFEQYLHKQHLLGSSFHQNAILLVVKAHLQMHNHQSAIQLVQFCARRNWLTDINQINSIIAELASYGHLSTVNAAIQLRTSLLAKKLPVNIRASAAILRGLAAVFNPLDADSDISNDGGVRKRRKQVSELSDAEYYRLFNDGESVVELEDDDDDGDIKHRQLLQFPRPATTSEPMSPINNNSGNKNSNNKNNNMMKVSTAKQLAYDYCHFHLQQPSASSEKPLSNNNKSNSSKSNNSNSTNNANINSNNKADKKVNNIKNNNNSTNSINTDTHVSYKQHNHVIMLDALRLVFRTAVLAAQNQQKNQQKPQQKPQKQLSKNAKTAPFDTAAATEPILIALNASFQLLDTFHVKWDQKIAELLLEEVLSMSPKQQNTGSIFKGITWIVEKMTDENLSLRTSTLNLWLKSLVQEDNASPDIAYRVLTDFMTPKNHKHADNNSEKINAHSTMSDNTSNNNINKSRNSDVHQLMAANIESYKYFLTIALRSAQGRFLAHKLLRKTITIKNDNNNNNNVNTNNNVDNNNNNNSVMTVEQLLMSHKDTQDLLLALSVFTVNPITAKTDNNNISTTTTANTNNQLWMQKLKEILLYPSKQASSTQQLDETSMLTLLWALQSRAVYYYAQHTEHENARTTDNSNNENNDDENTTRALAAARDSVRIFAWQVRGEQLRRALRQLTPTQLRKRRQRLYAARATSHQNIRSRNNINTNSIVNPDINTNIGSSIHKQQQTAAAEDAEEELMAMLLPAPTTASVMVVLETLVAVDLSQEACQVLQLFLDLSAAQHRTDEANTIHSNSNNIISNTNTNTNNNVNANTMVTTILHADANKWRLHAAMFTLLIESLAYSSPPKSSSSLSSSSSSSSSLSFLSPKQRLQLSLTLFARMERDQIQHHSSSNYRIYAALMHLFGRDKDFGSVLGVFDEVRRRGQVCSVLLQSLLTVCLCEPTELRQAVSVLQALAEEDRVDNNSNDNNNNDGNNSNDSNNEGVSQTLYRSNSGDNNSNSNSNSNSNGVHKKGIHTNMNTNSDVNSNGDASNKGRSYVTDLSPLAQDTLLTGFSDARQLSRALQRMLTCTPLRGRDGHTPLAPVPLSLALLSVLCEALVSVAAVTSSSSSSSSSSAQSVGRHNKKSKNNDVLDSYNNVHNNNNDNDGHDIFNNNKASQLLEQCIREVALSDPVYTHYVYNNNNNNHHYYDRFGNPNIPESLELAGALLCLGKLGLRPDSQTIADFILPTVNLKNTNTILYARVSNRNLNHYNNDNTMNIDNNNYVSTRNTSTTTTLMQQQQQQQQQDSNAYTKHYRTKLLPAQWKTSSPLDSDAYHSFARRDYQRRKAETARHRRTHDGFTRAIRERAVLRHYYNYNHAYYTSNNNNNKNNKNKNYGDAQYGDFYLVQKRRDRDLLRAIFEDLNNHQNNNGNNSNDSDDNDIDDGNDQYCDEEDENDNGDNENDYNIDEDNYDDSHMSSPVRESYYLRQLQLITRVITNKNKSKININTNTVKNKYNTINGNHNASKRDKNGDINDNNSNFIDENDDNNYGRFVPSEKVKRSLSTPPRSTVKTSNSNNNNKNSNSNISSNYSNKKFPPKLPQKKPAVNNNINRNINTNTNSRSTNVPSSI